MFKLNKLTPFLLLLTVIILIVPISGGCGGDSETGTQTSNTFLELMSLVPADAVSSDEWGFINFDDHASFYKDNGITFSTPQEFIDIIITKTPDQLQLIPEGHFITGFGRFMSTSTIQKEYVGYDISCIDAEIGFGPSPFEEVAAIGRFDPQATKNALQNQSEWPDWAKTAYATEEYQGVTIHTWGDGYQVHITTKLMPPHIDEVGRAMPLAVTKRYLFYAPSLEAVKHMIDASQNRYTSLADLPEYAAIANGLTKLKAYPALAGDASLANGPLSRFNIQLTGDEKEQFIKNAGVLLKKFLTFGAGLGRDEKGLYTAIVIYHDNPADALANVSLLKQHIENDSSTFTNERWSEIITGTDIWAEGNTLLAKLYSFAGLWSSWVYSQDTLLFHEE